MQDDPVVIVSYARTPIGNLQGELQTFSGHELGTIVIKAALERACLKGEDIHEVIMGCVLPAGQGQAPARQAAVHAGIPYTTPCTTINKVCGSSMKALMLANDMIKAGSIDTAVIGGMESMTNAPYLLKKARSGYRLGHGELYDHMMLDGLEDAYEAGKAMGCFAEECVDKYSFTREQQDEYSLSSFERAQAAVKDGKFKAEIAPVTVKTRKGETVVENDERPFSVNPEKIPTLRAAFKKDGTVTAGNASSIADGAAALTVMRQSDAEKRGLKPVARVIGHSTFAKPPAEFTTAPIDATKKLLEAISWNVDDVDLFEVNEAFAVVAMAFMHDLKIPREKVNIHGGACALGHPIGATGARIIVSLLAALTETGGKRGIATLCIGGGEATAVAFEMCE